jgi:hypothetical protein
MDRGYHTYRLLKLVWGLQECQRARRDSDGSAVEDTGRDSDTDNSGRSNIQDNNGRERTI